ncbi:type I-F CRISPR-associated protein Csy1 [Legionella sp.]|uniref:type I-F CRISPR-associated protein Csy1 n=1 Tax=Legionella sp. TaxID=459 RepID=UPI00321FA784
MDESIRKFLSDRKDERIKKKIKSGMTSEEIFQIEHEASQEFMLENWLPGAAKKADQLRIATHPPKFSHPDAKISSVIAEMRRDADGFLRTGNVHVDIDVIGNAAALDVFKFLSLVLNDGQTILRHLESNTQKIQDEFRISSASFEKLRTDFLSIKKSDDRIVTSGKIKQVYFPVADSYHLLSILTPSGLLFELRKRIQEIRFSEQTKQAREDKRKNVFNEMGFDDLYGLVMIGFGGTKPQNISVLNSTYGGKAYLLPCIPPSLIKKRWLPKRHFFKNLLPPKSFADEFKPVHQLLKTDYNNRNIRDGLKIRLQIIIDKVIEMQWSIRLEEEGWSAKEQYTDLPMHQKIWLDDAYKEDRLQNDEWLDKIVSEFAHWFIYAYKTLYGNHAIFLADPEFTYIKSLIENNKEDLR